MNFHGKELIDISFEEFDGASSKGILTKKTHISGIFEDCNPAEQKSPNSVSKSLSKTSRTQESFWKNSAASSEIGHWYRKVNSKLKELGFTALVTNQSTLENLIMILEEILNEFSFTKSKANSLEKTLKVQKEIQLKSEQLSKRKKNAFDTFEYECTDENLQDLFKEVMNKNFNQSSEDDINIYTFIKYVEIQRSKTLKKIEDLNTEKVNLTQALIELQSQNKSLLYKLKKPSSEKAEKLKITDQVCADLGIQSVKDLPEAIYKFQSVMFALPGVEKFVSDISEEFVSEYSCKKLEDIVPCIRSLKNQLAEAEEFKKRVFLLFGSDNFKDIVHFSRGISQFCKLFEVASAEQLLPTVENLFYFIRQVKSFTMVPSK